MKSYSIVFTTDQNYVQHLSVTLISLLKNTELVNAKGIILNIYIIHGGIKNSDWIKIEEMVIPYKNVELKNLLIDNQQFESLIITHHFTKATYYRFLIPKLIKEDVVLYLDVDIVVNGDVKELLNIELEEFYIAAVRANSPGFSRYTELKMSSHSPYFSAGVMLINNKLWKRDNISEKAINFIENNRKVIKNVDQDGLNAIIDGKFKDIPLKYNYNPERSTKRVGKTLIYSPQEIKEAERQPVIIHFSGDGKPWEFGVKYFKKELYFKYLKMTPFKKLIPVKITPFLIIRWMIPERIRLFLQNIFTT